jgi:hypothetical protein
MTTSHLNMTAEPTSETSVRRSDIGQRTIRNVEHEPGIIVVRQYAQVINVHDKMNKSRPFKEKSVNAEVPNMRSASFSQMHRWKWEYKKWNKSIKTYKQGVQTWQHAS